ncbi:sugar phosphate nucleotidyltransferase [Halobacteriovorax sp. JY17]|uniref:sugar nucleotidyltransferase n=1 Tax=Halobacteriovorax sp. JY17 TaxID=2014617 RepID=UPI000C484E6F|nr:sugar phosphate nucleotidyltransferase [Halobacteriovorax sp. JY17]PIK14677.1 MAG: hypothetical protein CES88_10085 [Halobacteriovorax sp. JY17]
MRGIILAGGAGSRLYPATEVITKQLLPVYDKPMIYYPLSLLMLGGIREILVITTPRGFEMFQALLGDGSHLGIKIEFEEQDKPSVPRSKYAIPGLYVFDKSVCQKARELKPSSRGEIEIIDILKKYLESNDLSVQVISRGVAWLDAGTPKSLLGASSCVSAIEEGQGFKVACLEEVAYRKKIY